MTGPHTREYARATARVEEILEQRTATADEVIEAFVSATWDLLGLTSACWHHTDPASGLPVSSSVAGDPPGSLEWSLQYEYARPDVGRFAELRTRRTPVASISSETRGAMLTSARYREMIQPAGAVDELRIAFRDAFGIWATLVVFTDRAVAAADLRFAAEVVPAATAALRSAAARTAIIPPGTKQPREPATGAELMDPREAQDPGGPSVVVLDAGDAVLAADTLSRARLKVLPEDRDVALPGVVACLAAQARAQTGIARATTRMRTLDGRWFELDASAMPNTSGSVAVVIQPAGIDGVRDAIFRALGLSAREREVALRAAQGQSAKEIALDLHISRWTVQDHLKAVYAKTGTNSRADLSARLGGS